MARAEKEYKKSKKILTTKIFQAKDNSWKELIKEIDNDPWGIPYKLVMNRLGAKGQRLTETLEEEVLEKVIFRLFPREEDSEEARAVPLREWKEEWDVSHEEPHRVIMRKGARNTAPGADGLSTKIWRKTPDNMIRIIAQVYTKCMREGEFPEQWKRAKLVLTPKGN